MREWRPASAALAELAGSWAASQVEAFLAELSAGDQRGEPADPHEAYHALEAQASSWPLDQMLARRTAMLDASAAAKAAYAAASAARDELQFHLDARQDAPPVAPGSNQRSRQQQADYRQQLSAAIRRQSDEAAELWQQWNQLMWLTEALSDTAKSRVAAANAARTGAAAVAPPGWCRPGDFLATTAAEQPLLPGGGAPAQTAAAQGNVAGPTRRSTRRGSSNSTEAVTSEPVPAASAQAGVPATGAAASNTRAAARAAAGGAAAVGVAATTGRAQAAGSAAGTTPARQPWSAAWHPQPFPAFCVPNTPWRATPTASYFAIMYAAAMEMPVGWTTRDLNALGANVKVGAIVSDAHAAGRVWAPDERVYLNVCSMSKTTRIS